MLLVFNLILLSFETFAPFSELHAYSEEGKVIEHGIIGIEATQHVGKFNHRTLVVTPAGEQSELTRHVADMHVKRNEELRRTYYIPYTHVNNAVVSHKPAKSHIDTLEGRGRKILRQTARCQRGVGSITVGIGQLAVNALDELPRRQFGRTYIFMTTKLLK